MKLASSKTLDKRFEDKKPQEYGPPKDYMKNNVSAPRKLKHNAGDGGDYARTFMSDFAVGK